MEKHKRSWQQNLIYAGIALLVLLIAIGTGLAIRYEIYKIHHREAKNILYHYSDKIMLQMQGTLNEANALAQTALATTESGPEWFEQTAAPLLERDEVCFAFLFTGDTLASSLPSSEFGSLHGKNLDEFSYIFTMAKVVKNLVVEGPVVMEFDDSGQEVFLFLQPIIEDNVYLGEVAVALKRSYVLEELGLKNLSAQGYDYELWRVEPQNGGKEVIATSHSNTDFSQSEKIVFNLPTQWNLSIQPKEGWFTPRQKGDVLFACTLLACLLLAFVFLSFRFYRLRFIVKRSELHDSQTGLYNRKGFTACLERWLSDGSFSFVLFYFSIEEYEQTVQLIGTEEESRYLGGINGRLDEYIHSPYLAGRAGGGSLLVAVREEMIEHDRETFARGLTLELLLKFRLDGQRQFLMPQYQYTCCGQDKRRAEGAAEIIAGLIHAYHDRVSLESPVKMLTEKCRQLIEGKDDVIFDEYTNPDMLELSKTFNRYRKHVEQLAYSDPVFNVGNRPKFFKDANMLISYDRKRRFSLFCLDVRGFSQYNELFSADVGDEILHEVRQRMSRPFGSYLYRINGDVFLGISLSDEGMELISSRLLQMFERPVTVKNLSFPLHVRIAACQYPMHGANPNELIDCIQSALRFAKDSDEDIVIYNNALAQIIKTEADILHRLKNAIEQQTLELWYQPMLLHETGRFSAVEALVRLSDGKGGYFPAGQVVSLAERNGIVELLGDYVLKKACDFMKAYGDDLGLLRIGINLSVQQLLVGNSTSHLMNLIQESGVDMHHVTLEITESLLIQSIDQAAETLEALRHSGVHIALDDFGVGYSSLNYLTSLPVDIIKIDRSLTKQILTNYKQHTLLKTIVEMAAINDLTVVAEGVETEAEQKVIASSGVQYIQGYYYARPMPEEEVIQFLKKS